jgi:hypothetical protein
MDTNAILTIISAGLGLLALIAGGFWASAKGKLTQVVSLGKEVVDVIEALDAALADNTITPEELAAIKKEVQSVKDAFKLLLNK